VDDTDVHTLLGALAERGWTLAVAEGDTGGVLLEWLTAVPGSSSVLRGGVVAYHDDLKRGVLGVAPQLIEQHGAVSAQVAEAMAHGVRRVAGADVGLATTGIAGPGGGTATKPVGLAYVAAVNAARAVTVEHRWPGDRSANRRASAQAAVRAALELLHSHAASELLESHAASELPESHAASELPESHVASELPHSHAASELQQGRGGVEPSERK
jgi:PncC family amidohydrolase